MASIFLLASACEGAPPTPGRLVAQLEAQPQILHHRSFAASAAKAQGPSDLQASHCSVDLYGDSILHGGYGGSFRLEEPPSTTLHRLRPRYQVTDHTVNGETATARAKVFERESRTGHFVVIAHGINDAAQNLPLEPALRAMIAVSRREGREVILTGLSRQLVPVPGRTYSDGAIRRVAADLRVPFADWDTVEYSRAEMADILHPAKSYSDRLVRRIVNVLDSLAPECAQ
ncbi:GDSL-like Lipase/Acylhydrolase family protein [Variovorax sp. YR752]|uniref:SGNH/GDSL hydrolase family protein n=1 Tax=unclassified Variovorax TaxID=663243 RepID=UPI000BDCCADA|nr:SGNH/GDSL hydrolase family protein [Variovorax sp. YR752]SOE06178.1 GDSL-like Lipase/Acylhydrolase family protein [Variovorax sp. YR752]